MNRLRSLDIKFLKGIGPKRAELLHQQLGIASYRDLLYHFPLRYVDRSSFYKISQFEGDMPAVQVKGRFVAMSVQGEGAKTRLVGVFTDGTTTMEIVWFHSIKQLRDSYHIGNEYIVFGKPEEFNGRWSMVHPEIDLPASPGAMTGLRGVYPLTDKLRQRGISSRQIFTWIQTALTTAPDITETLPRQLMERLKLMPLRQALVNIHNPQSLDALNNARFRLKFEELLYLQLNIQRYTRNRNAALAGFRFNRIGEYFNRFYFEQLPFELTGAQKRVIKEIRADMATGRQMNRLLQGDVGSGKTAVAAAACYFAAQNGMQCALMAPTEILAVQHYHTMQQFLEPLGVSVGLLTGSVRAKERREIYEALSDGSMALVVGTHAIFQKEVSFARLALVITDEQHRFGVAQRTLLADKGGCPHKLVMSATPIPRTLALMIYGDLDISVLKELPHGRLPVQTFAVTGKLRQRAYHFIRQQLEQGHQGYIVCPMIDDRDESELQAVSSYAENIQSGAFAQYRVGLLHGRMKAAEKDAVMSAFRNLSLIHI